MEGNQTRSLTEARIKKQIEYIVTQGRGYKPRTIFERSEDNLQVLEDSLQLLNLFGNSEYLDPIYTPFFPPIKDPDQRPIYFY